MMQWKHPIMLREQSKWCSDPHFIKAVVFFFLLPVLWFVWIILFLCTRGQQITTLFQKCVFCSRVNLTSARNVGNNTHSASKITQVCIPDIMTHFSPRHSSKFSIYLFIKLNTWLQKWKKLDSKQIIYLICCAFSVPPLNNTAEPRKSYYRHRKRLLIQYFFIVSKSHMNIKNNSKLTPAPSLCDAPSTSKSSSLALVKKLS